MLTRTLDALQSLGQLCLPQKLCLGCLQPQYETGDWCSSCLTSLSSQPQQRCYQCGIAIGHGERCGDCIKQSPPFAATYVLDDYQWPLNSLIGQLKYGKQKALARGMAQLFYQQHPNITQPDCLCSVPMHWRKQWQRGFNQSEELCRSLARLYKLPMQQPLKRVESGQDLIGLNAKARRKALANCYQVNPKQPRVPAHIAIVDDVVTTGSTAILLTKLLKSIGAERVDIWAIARTPSPSMKTTLVQSNSMGV